MSVPDGGGREGPASGAESSVLAEAMDRIAHQLKNPLQAMTVNLEVIRIRAGEGDVDEVERLTRVVDENVRRVDRRIRMLVALARRSPDETPTDADLEELVREASAAFRLDDREDGPGLRVRAPDEGEGVGDAVVRVRPGELLALILSVASRATRADSGGEPPYLAVGADGAGGWIEVGPGDLWGDPGERRAIAERARRAGGEVEATGRDGSGPVRVRFRRP